MTAKTVCVCMDVCTVCTQISGGSGFKFSFWDMSAVFVFKNQTCVRLWDRNLIYVFSFDVVRLISISVIVLPVL